MRTVNSGWLAGGAQMGRMLQGSLQRGAEGTAKQGPRADRFSRCPAGEAASAGVLL